MSLVECLWIVLVEHPITGESILESMRYFSFGHTDDAIKVAKQLFADKKVLDASTDLFKFRELLNK